MVRGGEGSDRAGEPGRPALGVGDGASAWGVASAASDLAAKPEGRAGRGGCGAEFRSSNHRAGTCGLSAVTGEAFWRFIEPDRDQPLTALVEAHVRGGERIHIDDTPVPALAKGKTRTGRLWTVVRDDRPFGVSNSVEH